jgi:uncharacterized protein (UPF0333 family)
MNKKGIELAISTLILIIIGLAVLIGVAYILTGGFKSFKGSTDPLLSASQTASVKEACKLACTAEDRITLCCKQFNVGNNIGNVTCLDKRLEISCGLSCEGFNCTRG